MYNYYMQKRYKTKTFKVRFILLFFGVLTVFMLSVGFFPIQSLGIGDELYTYQWYLHGNTNFMVGNSLLAKNFECFSLEDFNNIKVESDGHLFVRDVINDSLTIENNKTNINFENAHYLYENQRKKTETIVALIDTGIDINHKDLINNIWQNHNEIPNNNIDDDHNGYIDDYNGWNFYDNNNKVYTDPNIDIHGTHSAGLIGANQGNGGIKGVASNQSIKIMPIKVLGANGLFGRTQSLIDAIKYAENNGAKICNLSLGSYKYNEELARTIKASKMLFVVACGNGENYIGYNIDSSPVYPASFDFDNIISVANVSIDGKLSPSSNYGNTVTLAAPGTFILSTIPDNRYGFFTGSSMAAPIVTGVASMIKSLRPELNPIEIKNILMSTCDTSQELIAKVRSNGIINAYRAIYFAITYNK